MGFFALAKLSGNSDGLSDSGSHPSESQPHLQSSDRFVDDKGNAWKPLSREDDMGSSGEHFFQEDDMSNTRDPLSQEDDMSNNSEHFSKEDDEAIVELKHQGLSWAEISDHLSGRDCRKRYHTHAKNLDKPYWHWTASEEQLISAFCTQISPTNWKIVSKSFEDRTPDACKARARKLGKAPIGDAKPWTEQEIDELWRLHADGKDWCSISESLTRMTGQTRTGSECIRWFQSERPFTYPSPVVYSNLWTAERMALVQTVREAGETWEYIAKRLKSNGVSFFADDCRNYWYNSCWEDYRRWIRDDGTLNLVRYEEEMMRGKAKTT